MKKTKSKEYREKEREAAEIRRDIATARSIIADGIGRYKKRLLRARSKKQAEDLSVFEELKDYNTRDDIHDAYGRGFITELQTDRLMEMWDAREKFINSKGEVENRVIGMLERAMRVCMEPYLPMLEEFDEMKQRRENDIREIEMINAEIDYERYIDGLRQRQEIVSGALSCS